MKRLIENLVDKFVARYEREPVLFKAPGRINFIGEHTDYNEGFVLPAAIDAYVYLAIQKNYSQQCHLYAADLDEAYEFSLEQELKPSDINWANFFLGVTHFFQEKGGQITGYDLMFSSTVPIGSGLSSSAALESSFGFGLNHLYDGGLTEVELAKAGQAAEHQFVGVKCGIMDQYASCLGMQGQALLIDCRIPEHTYIPCQLGKYQVVLFDSCVKHNLAESEYNVRREQCEAGVEIIRKKYPEVKSLRDVSPKQLESCRPEMEELVYRRCKYILEENARVIRATEALKVGDILKLGEILRAGHEGMRYGYEISCDEIDILVELANSADGVIGSRMMGGGFGGCTINLVEREKADRVTAYIEEQYRQRTGNDFKFYKYNIADGAGIII